MKIIEVLQKGLAGYKDEAILVARLGLGLMFVFVHGGPKVLGGPEKWLEVGSMLKVIGITFAPQILGLIAGSFELLGGLLIGLGLFTRLGAAMIFVTLLPAAIVMYQLKGMFGTAPALEDAFFMLVLLAIGAGKYSLDRKWFK